MFAGFALALAGIIGVFYEPTDEEIRSGGQKWACIYVGIGVACWIMGMLQVPCQQYLIFEFRLEMAMSVHLLL